MESSLLIISASSLSNLIGISKLKESLRIPMAVKEHFNSFRFFPIISDYSIIDLINQKIISDMIFKISRFFVVVVVVVRLLLFNYNNGRNNLAVDSRRKFVMKLALLIIGGFWRRRCGPGRHAIRGSEIRSLETRRFPICLSLSLSPFTRVECQS